jgi:hypothetical protein
MAGGSSRRRPPGSERPEALRRFVKGFQNEGEPFTVPGHLVGTPARTVCRSCVRV